MTSPYSEDRLIESTAIDIFLKKLDWKTQYAYHTETFGEEGSLGRRNKREVVLRPVVLKKLRELNPGLPDEAYEAAFETLVAESSTKSLADLNAGKYDLMRQGIPVDYLDENGEQQRDKKLRLFDFKTSANNDFLAVRQLIVTGISHRERRPDIVGFVNGVPLLFIELKAAHRSLESAYRDNLTDYKDTIPHLFHHNAFILLSNGLESRIGSITAKYQHFHEWKRLTEEEEGIVALERILTGVCEKGRFMDLFENFILFDRTGGEPAKLIARNHQFIGVNRAIAHMRQQNEAYEQGKISLEEKQKLGVFWHTQGSGKSYSMVFFAQKVHRTMPGSYTFLVVTDRNELDTQIYGTFGAVGAVPPVKAGSKKAPKATDSKHLRELLQSDHRYIFTLIHKFNFEEEITQRENIIVLSDEAHRTQGGTLALNLRNALPKAAFMGFTGTPLFKDDQLTRRIFGDYVSRYDFQRSVEDGATVPLHYENRGEYLKLENPKINDQIRQVLDEEAEHMDSDQRSKLEQLIARDYHILTAEKRLRAIARDVVWHFCSRGYMGKGMFIALDKLTAVRMYSYITEEWEAFEHQLEKKVAKGAYGDQETQEKKRELEWIRQTEISVVVSSEQNEVKKFRDRGLDIEPHREKMNSQDLESRFKEEDDPFRLVIVCAMWITGFDVPTLSTMYLDKPLKSHALMQAIARANRVSEGKINGLIVDYIETYKSLLEALAIYGTGSGAGGEPEPGETPAPPVEKIEALVESLRKSLEAIEHFLQDEVHFDLNTLVTATSDGERLSALWQALNAVNTNDETKVKFQVLARHFFRQFKALQPNKAANDFRASKQAIDAIYNTLEQKKLEADVSEILAKIQGIVDESIETMVTEPLADESRIIDLSAFDFEALEKAFARTPHRNTTVQALKDIVEQRLEQMVRQNPARLDFYKRYQEIIDAYNRGKDAATIENTFLRLLEFIEELSAEEAETKREGLTEEQKAVFDILRKQKISPQEKKRVKEIAIDLLEALKKGELQVDLWFTKTTTSAAVFNHVSDSLFKALPYPAYQNDDIELRSHLLFQHLKQQYWGGGKSAYGAY